VANDSYQPIDRRPIAARGWPIWGRTAKWLVALSVSPNSISLAGMGCGVAAGIALAGTTYAAGWERFAWL